MGREPGGEPANHNQHERPGLAGCAQHAGTVLAASVCHRTPEVLQAHPALSYPRTLDLRKLVLAACLAVFPCAIRAGDGHAGARSGPLTISVLAPQSPGATAFNMGQSCRPDGASLTLDSNSLRLNGAPWTPVMGEFHYARYPEGEWREELLKIKAGGVDVISTYVFWIHHEEIEGQFDWSGRRDLRHFVQLCGELGLKAI